MSKEKLIEFCKVCGMDLDDPEHDPLICKYWDDCCYDTVS